MKKKKNTAKPFTREELKMIRETPVRSLKDVAFLTGRSLASVRRKKWMMDNPDRDRACKTTYRRSLNRKLQDKASNKYVRWSKAEEKEILTSTLSDSALAKKMGRTLSSIQVKRMRLLRDQESRKRKK